jgi:two-component system alkaline phosphatase synthesis response regulator PhoP
VATVLVVDDEPDLLLLARVNLERDGHRVVTACDGETALASVRNDAPDVVVLDVMMPGVDGWAVLGEVKSSADQRVKEIPIVMLTSLSGPELVARGGIEGAVRWLTKPFPIEDLRTAVREALDEPEPVQRKRAQHRALKSIARLERGDVEKDDEAAPQPRLSGLEHRADDAPPPGEDAAGSELELNLGVLTRTQRQVIDAVQQAPTMQAAAASLGITRSSLYATLRRAARRLGVRSVRDLLARLRTSDRPPLRR